MAEPTNPATGVEQVAPTQESMEGLLDKAFQDKPEVKEAPAKTDSQESPAEQASDELTPDDLPEAEGDKPADQHSPVDAFEIVHNGTQHKLSREETIRYAQQGFDYTQKTQAVAEKDRQVQERLARVAEIEQVQPVLAQDLALVAALEAQLRPYQNADWVKLATDDPIGYSQQRAKFDVLLQQYQGAANQYHQKAQYVQAQKAQLTQQTLQQEFAQLTERIPQWKDPQKFEAGRTELRAYLTSQGASQADVDGLTSSLAVSIAHKAMQYDKLLKSKADKVKQLRAAPPVVKGGIQQNDGKADFNKFREGFVKAGLKGNHRAQEDSLARVFERTFKK